jgi:uncharacterized delta-60 repeat protein
MDIKFTLQAQYSGTQFIAGPFNLSGTTDTNITYELATNISKASLLTGYTVTTPYNITGGTIQSLGSCIITPAESYTLQFSNGPIIVGNFNTYSGVSSNGIVKLDDFGNIDYSFNVGTGFPTGTKNSPFGGATNLLMQSDGKLLVTMVPLLSSSTSFYDGVICYGIIRLNPDGSRDYSFNPPTFFSGGSTAGTIRALGCQSNGKIIVGGDFTGPPGLNKLVRLNTNGSIDTSFSGYANGTVVALLVQNDDKIIIAGNITGDGGSPNLRRLNVNGTIDNSFVSVVNPTLIGGISVITKENDNRILLGGTITSYNGTTFATPRKIIRVDTYGSLDPVFVPPISGGNDNITAITVQPNNSILIGGYYGSVPNLPNGIGRLLPTTGAIDTSFTGTGISYIVGSGNTTVNNINLLPNGDLFITGRFITYNGSTGKNQMVKINSDGSLDSTFVVAAESATLCDNFDSVYIT